MHEAKVLQHDPFTGLTKYFHPDGDDFVIQTEMPAHVVDDIVEANRLYFNDAPSTWENGRRVASIPIHIYWDLKRKGIADDDAAMRRWLNDPDNRFFRTFPGTV